MNPLPMRALSPEEIAVLEAEQARREAMPETKNFKPQLAAFGVGLAAVARQMQHPDRGIDRDVRLAARAADDVQERRDRHAAKLARRAARAQR